MLSFPGVLTINVQPRAMRGRPRSVGGDAGVEAAVVHDGPADVDVADDLAVQRHVLAHHVPGGQRRLECRSGGGRVCLEY